MILLVAAAAACPALTDALDAATVALVEGPPPAADRALADAAHSLECAPVTPEDLGRYWLLEGVRAELAGDTPRATRAFAASRRATPTGWDPRFGASVEATWRNAGAEGAGWLTVDTNHAGARVDGLVPPAWPAPVAGGVHLVQVLAPDGATVWYGKVVRVAEGEEVLVETGLPEASPGLLVGSPDGGPLPLPGDLAAGEGSLPTAPIPFFTRPRVRSAAWLTGSGVAAAGAATLYYLAATTGDDLAAADDLRSLNGAWTRQRLCAGGAVLLSGATAFGVVGAFVF